MLLLPHVGAAAGRNRGIHGAELVQRSRYRLRRRPNAAAAAIETGAAHHELQQAVPEAVAHGERSGGGVTECRTTRRFNFGTSKVLSCELLGASGLLSCHHRILLRLNCSTASPLAKRGSSYGS